MDLQSLLEKLRDNRNKLNDGEPNEENVNEGLQLVIDILGYNIRPTDNIGEAETITEEKKEEIINKIDVAQEIFDSFKPVDGKVPKNQYNIRIHIFF